MRVKETGDSFLSVRGDAQCRGLTWRWRRSPTRRSAAAASRYRLEKRSVYLRNRRVYLQKRVKCVSTLWMWNYGNFNGQRLKRLKFQWHASGTSATATSISPIKKHANRARNESGMNTCASRGDARDARIFPQLQPRRLEKTAGWWRRTTKLIDK